MFSVVDAGSVRLPGSPLGHPAQETLWTAPPTSKTDSFHGRLVFAQFVPYSPRPDHEPDLEDLHMHPRHVPERRTEPHFTGLAYVRCLAADTCLLTNPSPRTTLGEDVMVKLAGVEAPSLKGRCEQESALAHNAQDLLHVTLSQASDIDLYPHYVLGLQTVGRVVADGQDLSSLLIEQGLAVKYAGGDQDWCAD